MRTPEAMPRWSWLYCIVRWRMGSKNRCIHMVNPTNTPHSSVLSVTMDPPSTMMTPMAKPMRVSTMGWSPPEKRLACMLASRCS